MTQGMRLEQRLTPQLIQSMEILQLPLAALEARIESELQENPALDLEESSKRAEVPKEDGVRENGVDGGGLTVEDGEKSFSRLDKMSQEYDFDAGDRGYSRLDYGGDGRDAKMDAMANAPDRTRGSVQDYLREQWSLEEVSDDLKRRGELLINFIEDTGYLDAGKSLEDIAATADPPVSVEDLEEALLEMQHRVDPPGLAARNLKECLLLQLNGKYARDSLERKLVENHLEDLMKNRLPAVSKATGKSIDEIKEALQHLSKLNPHPGYTVVDRRVPTISPDVIADYAEDGKGWEVRLVRGNWHRLRISPNLRKIVQDRDRSKEERDYARKKIEAASALIDAIQYRRERLLEIAKVILDRQKEFFEEGPQAMKVLRMSELAEKFECDPSTISRTVAGKYLQTPRGIFPLREFFTGGTETTAGEVTSWDAVKARVKQIIDEEDKSAPLSDDQITAKLRGEELDVSRRTIAKYRQQLGIPSARQRKQF
jgi:RNA polymerase sigma-54 factor